MSPVSRPRYESACSTDHRAASSPCPLRPGQRLLRRPGSKIRHGSWPRYQAAGNGLCCPEPHWKYAIATRVQGLMSRAMCRAWHGSPNILYSVMGKPSPCANLVTIIVPSGLARAKQLFLKEYHQQPPRQSEALHVAFSYTGAVVWWHGCQFPPAMPGKSKISLASKYLCRGRLITL